MEQSAARNKVIQSGPLLGPGSAALDIVTVRDREGGTSLQPLWPSNPPVKKDRNIIKWMCMKGSMQLM